ncbi:NAD(P)-dependent dehydrogenase (short-subunit alcohol dehydrogenase family) [Catenuloplanes nepalensis]|uniref:NAD(P)-dependent dehydrogenase (Short-subunit alcohol dehydrogenase family) n=1 Tax=Catenuloplanes nepalensis TaxID=587533 RepID=A0ABT9MNR1_9ACTN|nr:SDR family oxidoreductase [Catenuloplanes nepalensis]MDP9793070.1 NAD(P)-dependent dehydrogenase (short-subunit alcohol dehydrogenase family) [Catenuloplanes nepalensis]
MSELTGKTALVTGATSGIGRATAIALAARGAHVVITGRNAERGAEVVEKIQADGGTARFVAVDLADEDDVRRLARDAGEVDVLVNSAGAGGFGASAGFTTEQYNALFDTNVRAIFLLTAALAPKMAERGGGSVINVSSGSAVLGDENNAIYAATKGAVNAITRAFAAEYGPANVRVNAVSPGPTYTSVPAMWLDRYIDLIPLRRVGRPEDVAEVIAFLAGPGGSYVNATVIPVDGGLTAVEPPKPPVQTTGWIQNT